MEARMTVEEVPRFHWADYLVFALSLVACAAIGVFYGFVEKKNKTTADQLVGGRSMRPLPVAMSCLASFLSAPFIIGIPAEIYYNGPMYSVIAIGYVIAAPITNYGFIPTFHRLNITTAYEYLERRFSRSVRVVASVVFLLMMLFYMGVVVYAPARAFSQVTGMPELVTILALGAICTFYTAVGGMKAVIWTDVLQMVIILIGLVILVVKGTVDAGGATRVMSAAYEGGRLDFSQVSLWPTARHTWWTQAIGGALITLTVTATNQAMIQRYLSINTTRDAQLSVWYTLALMICYLSLVIALGLVMYTCYRNCDPLSSGRVFNADNLIPLFMMETLGSLHGIPGLFTAAVFSATLSTLSSGVNALAAVILIDMIKPSYTYVTGKDLKDRISAIITKVMAAVLGFVTVGVAYLAPLLGSTLLQVALSLFGMVGGPVLGLFTLAVFLPCVNHWGALAGLLSSLVVTFWVSVGATVYPSRVIPLPVSVENCSSSYNWTATGRMGGATVPLLTSLIEITSKQIDAASDTGFQTKDIYKLSYMWYGLLSVLVAVIVGLAVSLMTGGRSKKVAAELRFDYETVCGACCSACRGDTRCPRVDSDDETKDVANSLMTEPVVNVNKLHNSSV